MRKFLTPDAADTTAGTSTTSAPTDSHIRHMHNVPDKDAALLQVSQSVSAKWAASPFITLAFKTQADFAAGTDAFANALSARNTAGGGRSSQAHEVDTIDAQAEDAVAFVKAYITEKFGPPHAKAQFANFGLEHRSNHYDLPHTRSRRIDALRMMVAAIAANGFGDKPYGTAFWTDLKTRYEAAAGTALAGASDVSAGVSELVALRTELRRTLHSILLLLEANYPDTFDQAKREWGFLKEMY
jgi:hypothetical protein